MAPRFSLVYVTAKDMEEARRIANRLVGKRLIACANIFPVRSIYPWAGKVEEGDEVAIIMKTRTALVDDVIAEVRNSHSYEVPCIVSYPMGKGYKGYLDWMGSETVPKAGPSRKAKGKWPLKLRRRR